MLVAFVASAVQNAQSDLLSTLYALLDILESYPMILIIMSYFWIGNVHVEDGKQD